MAGANRTGARLLRPADRVDELLYGRFGRRIRAWRGRRVFHVHVAHEGHRRHKEEVITTKQAPPNGSLNFYSPKSICELSNAVTSLTAFFTSVRSTISDGV